MVSSNAPVELVFERSAGDVLAKLQEASENIPEKQLKIIKSIKNPQKDLVVFLEVAENIGDGLELVQNIVLPKRDLLLKRLAKSAADPDNVDIPAFEITKIVKDGNELKTRICMKKVKVMFPESQLVKVDEISLAALCKASITEQLMDATSKIEEKTHEICSTPLDLGPALDSKQPNEGEADQLQKNLSSSRELQVIKDNVCAALTHCQPKLSHDDAQILQGALDAMKESKKPIEILENYDQAQRKFEMREAKEEVAEDLLSELLSLKNVRDLNVTLETKHSLPNSVEIVHKVIGPPKERLCAIQPKIDVSHSDVPVFEISELSVDGNLKIRQTSVSTAAVTIGGDDNITLDANQLAAKCMAAITGLLAQLPTQEKPGSNFASLFTPKLTHAVESKLDGGAETKPASYATESVSVADMDDNQEIQKAREPKKGATEVPIISSEAVLSACEEILKSQGGAIEPADLEKYLNISEAADKVLDDVLQTAAKGTVSTSAQASLIAKKKEISDNKKELLKKKKLVQEDNKTPKSQAVQVLQLTTEASRSATVTENIPDSIGPVAEEKPMSSAIPPELADVLQSKLADAGSQAAAILLTLERSLASAFQSSSDSANQMLLLAEDKTEDNNLKVESSKTVDETLSQVDSQGLDVSSEPQLQFGESPSLECKTIDSSDTEKTNEDVSQNDVLLTSPQAFRNKNNVTLSHGIECATHDGDENNFEINALQSTSDSVSSDVAVDHTGDKRDVVIDNTVLPDKTGGITAENDKIIKREASVQSGEKGKGNDKKVTFSEKETIHDFVVEFSDQEDVQHDAGSGMSPHGALEITEKDSNVSLVGSSEAMSQQEKASYEKDNKISSEDNLIENGIPKRLNESITTEVSVPEEMIVSTEEVKRDSTRVDVHHEKLEAPRGTTVQLTVGGGSTILAAPAIKSENQEEINKFESDFVETPIQSKTQKDNSHESQPDDSVFMAEAVSKKAVPETPSPDKLNTEEASQVNKNESAVAQVSEYSKENDVDPNKQKTAMVEDRGRAESFRKQTDDVSEADSKSSELVEVQSHQTMQALLTREEIETKNKKLGLSDSKIGSIKQDQSGDASSPVASEREAIHEKEIASEIHSEQGENVVKDKIELPTASDKNEKQMVTKTPENIEVSEGEVKSQTSVENIIDVRGGKVNLDGESDRNMPVTEKVEKMDAPVMTSTLDSADSNVSVPVGNNTLISGDATGDKISRNEAEEKGTSLSTKKDYVTFESEVSGNIDENMMTARNVGNLTAKIDLVAEDAAENETRAKIEPNAKETGVLEDGKVKILHEKIIDETSGQSLEIKCVTPDKRKTDAQEGIVNNFHEVIRKEEDVSDENATGKSIGLGQPKLKSEADVEVEKKTSADQTTKIGGNDYEEVGGASIKIDSPKAKKLPEETKQLQEPETHSIPNEKTREDPQKNADERKIPGQSDVGIELDCAEKLSNETSKAENDKDKTLVGTVSADKKAAQNKIVKSGPEELRKDVIDEKVSGTDTKSGKPQEGSTTVVGKKTVEADPERKDILSDSSGPEDEKLIKTNTERQDSRKIQGESSNDLQAAEMNATKKIGPEKLLADLDHKEIEAREADRYPKEVSSEVKDKAKSTRTLGKERVSSEVYDDAKEKTAETDAERKHFEVTSAYTIDEAAGSDMKINFKIALADADKTTPAKKGGEEKDFEGTSDSADETTIAKKDTGERDFTKTSADLDETKNPEPDEMSRDSVKALSDLTKGQRAEKIVYSGNDADKISAEIIVDEKSGGSFRSERSDSEEFLADVREQMEPTSDTRRDSKKSSADDEDEDFIISQRAKAEQHEPKISSSAVEHELAIKAGVMRKDSEKSLPDAANEISIKIDNQQSDYKNSSENYSKKINSQQASYDAKEENEAATSDAERKDYQVTAVPGEEHASVEDDELAPSASDREEGPKEAQRKPIEIEKRDGGIPTSSVTRTENMFETNQIAEDDGIQVHRAEKARVPEDSESGKMNIASVGSDDALIPQETKYTEPVAATMEVARKKEKHGRKGSSEIEETYSVATLKVDENKTMPAVKTSSTDVAGEVLKRSESTSDNVSSSGTIELAGHDDEVSHRKINASSIADEDFKIRDKSATEKDVASRKRTEENLREEGKSMKKDATTEARKTSSTKEVTCENDELPTKTTKASTEEDESALRKKKRAEEDERVAAERRLRQEEEAQREQEAEALHEKKAAARKQERLKELQEREEALLQEEKMRQERRRKQKEEKEKELQAEEERLRKLNEEREEKRRLRKMEEIEARKAEEIREREKEKRRQAELEARRMELDMKHKAEEDAMRAEEEDRKAKRKQRLLDEEKALAEEREKMEKDLFERREARRKLLEEESTEKTTLRRTHDEKEENKVIDTSIRQREKHEKEAREFEEMNQKMVESKIRREEAEKLRARELQMLEDMERQRVQEEKKKLEEELRRREDLKRQQEEDMRQQTELFLKKEEERRKRRLEERMRWYKDDETGKLDYTEKELVVHPLPLDMRKPRDSESEDGFRRDVRRRPKFSTKLQDRQAARGTRVKLSCNVLCGPDDPLPEIEWFKGGYPLKEEDRIKTSFIDGLASLEIREAARSDSGEYTCTANNRHGRVTTSCDLRVKGEEENKPSPPTFTTSIRERYVAEDDELVLSCHVTGFPPPKTTWLKDADKVPASQRFQSVVSDEGICSLIIKNPRAADSGLYSCHAENRVYRDEISANVRVPVDRKSQVPDNTETPRFVTELCDQRVPEDGTLTLQVDVAGTPTPDILWLFNGRSLAPSGKMRVSSVGSSHTLTVFQVKEKDLGTYSCRIQNPYGNAYTLSTVSFGTARPRRGGSDKSGETEMRAPSFTERPESMITAFRDEELTLSCTVMGEPTPRVTWLKGMQDVSNRFTSHKTVQGNTHTWTLRGVQFTDSGTYTIEAKNAHGTVRSYCSVKVKDNSRSRSYSPRGTERFPSVSHDEDQRRMSGRFIRDVPGKVGTIRAVDVGKSWVSLKWGKPEHVGSCPVTAYKIEAWILGEEARWQELAVSPICSFDAYHLKPEREYLFRVTPRNKYGWGEVEMTPRPVRVGRTIEQPIIPRTLPRQVRCMPGGSISFDAQVTGDPLPEVRWYKDGSVLDPQRYPRFSTQFSAGTIHNVFGYVHKVSLRIDDLHWEDEGKYEMEAVNPGGRVTSYTRLLSTSDCSVLEAHEKINRHLTALSRMDAVPCLAPQFALRLRDRRVQVGFPVRLTCQVIAVPAPDVRWCKDGVPLLEDDGHRTWQEDGHFYSLELSEAQHEDAAIYSVTATNPYGCVTCRCRLIVDSGLRSYISPMFLRELEDVSVSEGETIILQTVIEAYPTIGVVWHRDGHRIRPSRKYTFDLDEDGLATLEIERARYSDGGLYTCTATNEMGTIESICRVSVASRLPDLSVAHSTDGQAARAPMFLRKPRAIDAEEGDMVIIECEVAGEPKPTVTWLRDWLKPSVYSDGSRFTEVDSSPVYKLEIPNCRLEDTGAYSILAKNDHGESRAVISLQVYTKGLKGDLKGGSVKRGVMEAVPRVVRPLQDVRCCDGDAVTLETLFDAPPACLVRWEKQGHVLKDTGDVSWDWDGARARLKIRAVYPEDEGEYCCIVYNDMGKAVTSATLVVEMAEDKENDLTVQMEHRPDLSRRTTPSRATPSRYSRSPSVTSFTREGSAHSWAGVGWREPSIPVAHWRPLSRGSSPLLFGRRYTPEPSARSKQKRAHGPKFYYIPHDRIVEEGETVTFQCAIKGHPTPKTSWDKDSMKLMQGGRYRMEERGEVRTIEITKVTQQDAGLYRVTIENDLGREQATARLDVIKASSNKYAGYVRSWHTSPLTAPRFTRALPSTSVRDGAKLKLSTDFTGSPAPRAKWYRNNELLPSCSDFEQTRTSCSATLEIAAATASDAGTYTCVIINDKGRAHCSCQVTVEHRLAGAGPPLFMEGLQHDTALDGDPLKLGVTLQGSHPIKVLWVKNDQIIEASDRLHIQSSPANCCTSYPTSSPTFSSNSKSSPSSTKASPASPITDSHHWLAFDQVIPDDSGLYLCEASNQHGEAYSFCRLKVLDPQECAPCPPTIIGAFTPLTVRERARARFRAIVTGHPRPAITWQLDGQPIVSSKSVQITCHESEEGLVVYLSFPSAGVGDSGTISLTATNVAGTQTLLTSLIVIPETDAERPRTSNASRSLAEKTEPPSSQSRNVLRTANPTDARKSRSPIKQKTLSIKSKPTASKLNENNRLVSVTTNKESSSQKSASHSSTEQSSPQSPSPRASITRTPSPHLTYQFKSLSASTSRSSIKSRSTSPVCITTRLCRLESLKNDYNFDYNDDLRFKSTVRRFSQEIEALSANGSQESSKIKSGCQSPTDIDNGAANLRGRPPIAKSYSKSTVVSRTQSNHLSRSVSPSSIKSISPSTTSSELRGLKLGAGLDLGASKSSASTKKPSQGNTSAAKSSSGPSTTSPLSRPSSSPSPTHAISPRVNASKVLLAKSVVQRSQSLKTPLRSSTNPEQRKLAAKYSFRAASLESRPERIIQPLQKKSVETKKSTEIVTGEKQETTTRISTTGEPLKLNCNDSCPKKTVLKAKPKSPLNGIAASSASPKETIKLGCGSFNTTKAETRSKSSPSRGAERMATALPPNNLTSVDAKSKRPPSPNLVPESKTANKLTVTTSHKNITGAASRDATPNSKNNSRVSALRDKFNENSSNSTKKVSANSPAVPRTFLRKVKIENSQGTFSASHSAEDKPISTPLSISRNISAPEIETKLQLARSSSPKYSKSNSYNKCINSPRNSTKGGTRVADISSKFRVNKIESTTHQNSTNNDKIISHSPENSEGIVTRRVSGSIDHQNDSQIVDEVTYEPLLSTRKTKLSKLGPSFTNRVSSTELELIKPKTIIDSTPSSIATSTEQEETSTTKGLPTKPRPSSLILISHSRPKSSSMRASSGDIEVQQTTMTKDDSMPLNTSTDPASQSRKSSLTTPPKPTLSSHTKQFEIKPRECKADEASVECSPTKALPPSPQPSARRENVVLRLSSISSVRSTVSSHLKLECDDSDGENDTETVLKILERHISATTEGERLPLDGHSQVKDEDDEEGAQITSGPDDVIVIKGQSATLAIRYCGNPEPEVTWLKKDQILKDDGRYTVDTSNGRSSLSIHNVTADDSAKYTVVVRNCISAHAGFASLSVEDVPQAPAAQPNLSEVGAGCVTLSWYGPAYDGGSVVTGYTVQTRKVGQVLWTSLVEKWHSTSYKVLDQEVGGQYEYRVMAHNIHGVSEPSKPSQPITLQGGPDKELQRNGARGDAPQQDDEEGDDGIADFEHCVVEVESGEAFSELYSLHEEVGKGRFGIVYRCTDKRTNKQRAAKIIKCIQAKEKEKVREEISIMNALRHPKLLQLAAAFERQRDVVMVMEFIAGGELFERVVADDFTLTERDVVLFMRQICEGVQYMHNCNILHLDLKPENILCVRKTSHKIKLIDFGLARRFDPAQPCRVLFGTPEFIAPEIINYEPISFASDMWSVGVICYVLLSGLSPFMGDNDAETFANITRAEFDFDDDAFNPISDLAKAFITSLLVNRKEKRLTSQECLQHPWLTKTEGAMYDRVIPTEKLKKFIIRRKWQKTGNAIRALGRMASLTNRRNSRSSSPTCLSPLPEQQPYSPSSSSSTAFPLLNGDKKSCPPSVRGNSVVSERSDSGISECSVSVDELLHNANNILKVVASKPPLTNGTPPAGDTAPLEHHAKGVEWQSSVDSAVGDVIDVPKTSSHRKISREAFVETSSGSSDVTSHSRI
ncbi:uncharacterized protein LOC108682041 isoform X2 [Hyalella azteca]|uniref:Myosin light chain kinase, smooth muscle n=1 Tax=Hyalella azteca TaxID=294128 RepID=A0A979FIF5_HYAAZ|nr:uncharacterized protein LOC108682041 isoform X2 [Hyalella azteca]